MNWANLGADVILLGVTVIVLRIMLGFFISEIRKDINELWDAVNTHGHKGLNGNNAKVTR